MMAAFLNGPDTVKEGMCYQVLKVSAFLFDPKRRYGMAVVRPFKAVRPAPEAVSRVASLPYDVYSREEAAAAVKGKPLSFLNIDRPETMFGPDHDMYAPEVYKAAAERYKSQKREGVYITENKACYYIYELTMEGRTQTGIAALSSVDDYLNGVCRKHENTVESKELDRIRHVDVMSAQTGPIFLAYHGRDDINVIVTGWKEAHKPVYDFVSEDGIRHRVWVIDSDEAISKLNKLFEGLEATYIADGHHRAASAVKVALKRRKEALDNGRPDENAEYNYFLSVLFPDSELKIYDYNRVVRDLNGLTKEGFLEALSDIYDIRRLVSGQEVLKDDAGVLRPVRKYDVGLYLAGEAYMLSLKDGIKRQASADPVKSLDVSVLQDHVLSPILGIRDPRTDKRIEFIGGIRGMGELIARADKYTEENAGNAALCGKGPAAAFAMYPTSIDELFNVADAGLLMPPKSTWFEPKLRSGLFIHEF